MSALGSLELQCDTQASHMYTPDRLSARASLLLSALEAGGAKSTSTDFFLYHHHYYHYYYSALPLQSTYYVEHQSSLLATKERTTKMFSNLGTTDTKTTLFYATPRLLP